MCLGSFGEILCGEVCVKGVSVKVFEERCVSRVFWRNSLRRGVCLGCFGESL